MKRSVKLDPWFSEQPEKAFLSDLTSPYHACAPAGFGPRPLEDGETDVSGLYLSGEFPDPNGLLETMYSDFRRFLDLCGIAGDRFPVILRKAQMPCFEAYSVTVTESEAVLSADDTEGIRRGLVWIEDELRRREGPYLPASTVERKPWLRSRITRCFFSPINRPPKYGDELTDDIDYYPEEYLNRLAHDGANGVWIYTRFSDLVTSSFLPDYGKGSGPRIDKLNRVIAKCARYGIRVYVFAIEPVALTPEQSARMPMVDGGSSYDGKRLFCVNTPEGRAFCEEAGEKLFTLCPDLGGYISITYGERATSCVSAFHALEGIDLEGSRTEMTCPRCRNLTPGQALANAAAALRAGIRKVNPNAEIVSWTYGHRFFPHDDVRDYVRRAPDDVMLMQNFEEMGYAEQLGRTRLGVDYWLSYAGPAPLFTATAEEAQKCGKHMFMKTQVCCSHELATLPYIPVPGLIFEKYKAGRSLGVEGVMQCWYFGNYPSLMSKAAGELAFADDFDDKHAFLRRLAGITWGNSRAEAAAQAWEAFEQGYANYPLNIMFSYYGPMHDGPVWQLQLEPKNFSLPRSWQTLDPTDGDRIGECMLKGHTPEEMLTLATRMNRYWKKGLRILSDLPADDPIRKQEKSVAEACGILLESGRNILEFYSLRDRVAWDDKPGEYLAAMESIVRIEQSLSRRLCALCEADGRLGYHSEGEGFKFFPEKLRARIEQLETLVNTEFPAVRARIAAGQPPLPYYLGLEPDSKVYRIGHDGIENAAWEPVGENAFLRSSFDDVIEDAGTVTGNGRTFRAAFDSDSITLELRSDTEDEWVISPEFRLFYPDVPVHISRDGHATLGSSDVLYYNLVGGMVRQELEKWHVERLGDGVLRVTISRRNAGWEKDRPFKLRLQNGDALWCSEKDPVYTLGKNTVSPLEHGWLIP